LEAAIGLVLAVQALIAGLSWLFKQSIAGILHSASLAAVVRCTVIDSAKSSQAVFEGVQLSVIGGFRRRTLRTPSEGRPLRVWLSGTRTLPIPSASRPPLLPSKWSLQ
jgi:hypothetical protein